MTNWIAAKVADLMRENRAAVLDEFYARGTGGSYRLIFEPQGLETWVDDGSEEGFYYPHTIKFGWESQIGVENNYFESVYEVNENSLSDIAEEVIEDWRATRCRFYPERPDDDDDE